MEIETPQEFNAQVEAWTGQTYRMMKSRIRRMRKGDGTAGKTTRYRTFKYYGETNRIQYKFQRHLVFKHKGVGRGYPAAKAGTGKRPADPWYNDILEKRFPKLAEIALDYKVTLSLKTLNQIKIK